MCESHSVYKLGDPKQDDPASTLIDTYREAVDSLFTTSLPFECSENAEDRALSAITILNKQVQDLGLGLVGFLSINEAITRAWYPDDPCDTLPNSYLRDVLSIERLAIIYPDIAALIDFCRSIERTNLEVNGERLIEAKDITAYLAKNAVGNYIGYKAGLESETFVQSPKRFWKQFGVERDYWRAAVIERQAWAPEEQYSGDLSVYISKLKKKKNGSLEAMVQTYWSAYNSLFGIYSRLAGLPLEQSCLNNNLANLL